MNVALNAQLFDLRLYDPFPEPRVLMALQDVGATEGGKLEPWVVRNLAPGPLAELSAQLVEVGRARVARGFEAVQIAVSPSGASPPVTPAWLPGLVSSMGGRQIIRKVAVCDWSFVVTARAADDWAVVFVFDRWVPCGLVRPYGSVLQAGFEARLRDFDEIASGWP